MHAPLWLMAKCWFIYYLFVLKTKMFFSLSSICIITSHQIFHATQIKNHHGDGASYSYASRYIQNKYKHSSSPENPLMCSKIFQLTKNRIQALVLFGAINRRRMFYICMWIIWMRAVCGWASSITFYILHRVWVGMGWNRKSILIIKVYIYIDEFSFFNVFFFADDVTINKVELDILIGR